MVLPLLCGKLLDAVCIGDSPFAASHEQRSSLGLRILTGWEMLQRMHDLFLNGYAAWFDQTAVVGLL